MLPTFIIIGAMKSGTTSLYHYLSKHPEIYMAGRINTSELDFFVYEKNYGKGIKWYESQFTGQARAYGESSPNYSKYPTFPGVPQRMYSVIPHAKLIYLLRDPIGRIVSHYVHVYAAGKENRTLSDALSKLENNYYIECSRYYMQLKQYLQYYSKENMLIITSEELKHQRRKTLETVFRFLGVDESFYSPEYEIMFHQSAEKKMKSRIIHAFSKLYITNIIKPYVPSSVLRIYKKMTEHSFEQPILDTSLEARLIEYLKDDTEALRKFTGKDFQDWCI